MYSNWHTDPDAGTGAYGYLLDTVALNPGRVKKADVERMRTAGERRVYGTFCVLLERPDGAILVSTGPDRTVYLVKGLEQRISEVVRGMPCVVRTTLLPAGDRYITYDSTLCVAARWR